MYQVFFKKKKIYKLKLSSVRKNNWFEKKLTSLWKYLNCFLVTKRKNHFTEELMLGK